MRDSLASRLSGGPLTRAALDGTAATRQGSYFHRAVPVDNASAAQYPDLTVRATTTQGAVSESGGHAFVPATPEAFTHDWDGNLTADGRWAYTWDGGNRVKWMRTLLRADDGSTSRGNE
jgi:hypothetical protein